MFSSEASTILSEKRREILSDLPPLADGSVDTKRVYWPAPDTHSSLSRKESIQFDKVRPESCTRHL